MLPRSLYRSQLFLSEFICPYIKMPLTRPCEVSSCTFNLSDTKLGHVYKRCFLNYSRSTSYNPYKKEILEKAEFSVLPTAQREFIATLLLNIKDEDKTEYKRLFYTSLFSVMTQDTTISLVKKCLDPVPYRQCCFCGVATDTLWFPVGNLLPPGFGYCSWNCWQDSPPPILSLTKMFEVDFIDLLKKLIAPLNKKARNLFMRHILLWIFGDSSIK